METDVRSPTRPLHPSNGWWPAPSRTQRTVEPVRHRLQAPPDGAQLLKNLVSPLRVFRFREAVRDRFDRLRQRAERPQRRIELEGESLRPDRVVCEPGVQPQL